MGLPHWLRFPLYSVRQGNADLPGHETQVSLHEAQIIVTPLGRYPRPTMTGKDVRIGGIDFAEKPLERIIPAAPPAKNARRSASSLQTRFPQIDTVTLVKRQTARSQPKGPAEWATGYDELS